MKSVTLLIMFAVMSFISLKELVCEPHTHVLKHGSPDKRVIPMVTFKMTGKNMLWFSQMKNNACITYSPDFNRCRERAVVITDLSLDTLLKSTGFVPFFLTRNAFIKTQNRCIFLHPHQTRLFRRVLQLCLSTRRELNERGKGTPAKWASLGQWDAVRLYVSKTNLPVTVLMLWSRHH